MKKIIYDSYIQKLYANMFMTIRSQIAVIMASINKI